MLAKAFKRTFFLANSSFLVIILVQQKVPRSWHRQVCHRPRCHFQEWEVPLCRYDLSLLRLAIAIEDGIHRVAL